MYNNQIYANGVYGTLKVRWTLRCETPLAIRNGLKVGYQDQDRRKSRGIGLRFKWQPPSDDRELASLHYGYEVIDAVVASYHVVPPSSIRGSLRSWTINHLVQSSYRSNMAPPSKEEEARTEEYLANIRQALADADSGYHWIASLFGLAFDTRNEEESQSNAGRLRIETTRFANAEVQPIAANGIIDDGMAGPGNARRQMTVRNPLDRMTHASKEGGLHHFLEFSRGETFEVHMTVPNPQGSDLGLFSLWRRELDSGMLRIGALSSIGRGRVSIQDQDYRLWLAPGALEFDWLEHFEFAATTPGDALADIWEAYALPAASLDQFLTYLQ